MLKCEVRFFSKLGQLGTHKYKFTMLENALAYCVKRTSGKEPVNKD